MADVSKVCTKCGESKAVSAFPRHDRTRDRLSSWCAGCHNEATRAYRSRQRVLVMEALEARRVAWKAQLREQAARAEALEASRGSGV